MKLFFLQNKGWLVNFHKPSAFSLGLGEEGWSVKSVDKGQRFISNNVKRIFCWNLLYSFRYFLFSLGKKVEHKLFKRIQQDSNVCKQKKGHMKSGKTLIQFKLLNRLPLDKLSTFFSAFNKVACRSVSQKDPNVVRQMCRMKSRVEVETF